ncbi:MAG TPA: transcriptional regulator [Clostridiales bacterium]|nr:transcriptional regulator [Clostridiales bacterium]HBP52358.1 transcriptional regulator [Clostridiales bacterium]HBW05732.1 transcriptional regulator [Clostridiales bacterium]HCH92797.1 transcriptional regulator [Clostridiales bacterium]
MSDKQYQVIVCIVNNGFADEAMDAARAVGARGGTVMSARGTANIEAEKAFQIQIQPEKEMIMILVSEDIKEDVMHALYRSVGTHTPAHGIAFAMPVDGVVGIGTPAQ